MSCYCQDTQKHGSLTKPWKSLKVGFGREYKDFNQQNPVLEILDFVTLLQVDS